MLRFILSWLLASCLLVSPTLAPSPPFAMRISCGARENVHTPPTNTLWFKDFAYTGGVPFNATLPSYISPPLKTLRYFPLSSGPENCYNINRVRKGHYNVRIFFGLVLLNGFNTEPLFDISIEGTQIYSLKAGWNGHDDQTFTEALVFLSDGTASICFHSTGHGEPAILAIEILQVDDNAYYFGPHFGEGAILRTATRLSCGDGKSKFDEDYSGDRWGGDRFWKSATTLSQADSAISTESSIKLPSEAPNFYPEALYQKAIVSSDTQPELTYTMEVDPNRNYSIWLHFAEIDPAITIIGERVFNVLINGYIAFEDVDVIKMAGGSYTALVLNTTVAVDGRILTIALHPKGASHAIINAIEVFEIIVAESRTLLEEVRALQSLKGALGLPLRFGWNGDPCVPQQHPWSGADCQFDRTSNKWVIDGLDLDNQGLRGFLPNDISKLHHLQSINLSGNNIRGPIPSSLGTITSLEVLDLSYNFFNGSIPESLGQMTSLRRLNLNGNSLSGKVPATLGGRLLHRASFNFTDNAGLCGMPGLPACGAHLTAGAKIGIGFGVSVTFLLVVIFAMCWWKRRQNILRAKQLAARGAPYAKARTHIHDIQLARNTYGHSRTAAESGPSLLT
ncbi:LRR_1 domain-containing protein/LRR_4 domain-containing protein/Malectin_like domain-containing protein [Cephalotus follicularis]|uniref:LRR_1 domain-containing protein/LRR_4 domain-containing protein/Malectin_like domain-containing protein n=1 Tax=Cephalotus follicularis TaxID=3775 RepID=A0A1Q3CFC4_CEPFO|nr:LRR_1 domain-containing protein/LRR_4 domain-containing protein/Malectin_like domain-containing protein [Cephalotus follicularis]